MSENNRQRVSIPIRGLDTSSTDINAPDGAMQELHNLRYSGEAWRNVKPFKVLERVGGSLLANKIFCYFDKEDTEFYIVSQFPVASDVNITAYWWDVDGEYTSTTSATLKAGMSRVHIEETQESFAWIELNKKSDDKYIYYTDRDSVPEGVIDWEVVYQHPADDDDIFIARKGYTFYEEEVVDLYRVRIKDGEAVVLSVIAERLPSDVRIYHLGKMLILLSDREKARYYYRLLSDGKYKHFEIPAPPVVRQSTELADRSDQLSGTLYHSLIEPITPERGDGTGRWKVKLYDDTDEIVVLPQHKSDNTFCGEICYFAVYQMADGSLVAPSALNITSSEPFYHGPEGMQYVGWNGVTKFACPTLSGDGDIYIETYHQYNVNSAKDVVFPWTFGISPYVKITIPKNIDEELIKAVNIYSTRINPIWDTAALKALSKKRKEYLASKPAGDNDLFWLENGTSAFGLFADNKLPEQPFYLLESIPIRQFASDSTYGKRITAKMFDNIEQKTMYEAVESHTMYASELFEYNSRMHAFQNGETKLFEGYGDSIIEVNDGDQKGECVVELKVDNDIFAARTEMSGSLQGNIVHSKILSYPDYRATYIYNNTAYKGRNMLSPSMQNNFAYDTWSDFIGGSSADFVGDVVDSDPSPLAARIYVKYSAKFMPADIYVTPPVAYSALPADNKLRVSAPSNPVVFPLANSYNIGSLENEIIAVNSAAIEMSDSKFGEFPLYAFTKEGIFALQSGQGEVLYGAIVPLNYDRIINPNTLAVNYNILYITDRGVHTLYSNEATLISEAINDAANQPLLDFLRTAKFAYQHKHGEVIFFNTDRDTTGLLKHPRAYTFSLGAKVWGTRDWNGGVVARELLNSGDMIEQTENSIILSDLNNEDRDDAATFRLVSRPIKFNNQEFKRIETMVTRLQASPAEYLDIKIEGSNDLVHWATLRDTTTQTASDVNIRRTPCSCRYFRVSIDCDTVSDVAVMGFDFEYYMRFLHRMR